MSHCCPRSGDQWWLRFSINKPQACSPAPPPQELPHRHPSLTLGVTFLPDSALGHQPLPPRLPGRPGKRPLRSAERASLFLAHRVPHLGSLVWLRGPSPLSRGWLVLPYIHSASKYLSSTWCEPGSVHKQDLGQEGQDAGLHRGPAAQGCLRGGRSSPWLQGARRWALRRDTALALCVAPGAWAAATRSDLGSLWEGEFLPLLRPPAALPACLGTHPKAGVATVKAGPEAALGGGLCRRGLEVGPSCGGFLDMSCCCLGREPPERPLRLAWNPKWSWDGPGWTAAACLRQAQMRR